jgi:hypothetical protein
MIRQSPLSSKMIKIAVIGARGGREHRPHPDQPLGAGGGDEMGHEAWTTIP